jgi:thymidylate synthase (FAD)
MIEVKLIDVMGNDLTVVNAARVSFGKKVDTFEGKDEGLIQYLAKHKHMSPFGHAFASFHVKAPIFVARQLVKHQYLRWNEISRRYVDSPPEFYIPESWRGRPTDKKQGSSGVVDLNNINTFGEEFQGGFGEGTLTERLNYKLEDDLEVYTLLIKQGVSPEQARTVLPSSLMTEWWWSGSLDAFSNMCNLRCKSDTQYETQLVAMQIDNLMKTKFPVSWLALRDN